MAEVGHGLGTDLMGGFLGRERRGLNFFGGGGGRRDRKESLWSRERERERGGGGGGRGRGREREREMRER